MNKRTPIFYMMLSLALAGALFISAIPQVSLAALAKNLTTLDCQKVLKATNIPDRTATDEAAREPNQVSRNLLFNVFSYGTISDRLRCDPLISGETPGGNTVISVYSVSKTLVNFAVLIILLIIAFANILRVKIDTYSVKKSIPLLIFGVILANLGLPLIRTLVDFAGVLTATLVNGEGGSDQFVKKLVQSVYIGGYDQIATVFKTVDGGTGWAGLLGLVGFSAFAVLAIGPTFIAIIIGAVFLILLPAIMFTLLGLFFVARIYVLVLLAAVSPIAFASLGFEPLKNMLWGWWWKNFINWTFMAPATFFLLWLAIRFYESTPGAAENQADLGTYITTLVIIYYALRVPLKMGGTMMGKWDELLVKPVGKALRSPFMAARGYVAKRGPIDASRALSLRNLNFARTVKEALGKVEEKKAHDEAQSPSALYGQAIGSLAAETGWKKVLRPGAVDEYRRSFNSTEGRKLLIGNTDDFMKRHLNFSDADIATRKDKDALTPAQLNDLEAAAAAAIKSGDPQQIAAAYYAHARIGLLPENHEEFLDPLRKQGVTQDQLNGLISVFAKEYEQRTGLPALIDSKPLTGTVDATETNKVIKDLRKALDKNHGNEAQQRRILQLMVEQLKKATNNLSNIEKLEKSPNYRGLATVILQEFKNLSPTDQRDISRSKITDMRGELGILDVRDVLNRDAVAGMQILRGAKKWENLQPLLTPDQAQETNLRYLDSDQVQAMIKSYENMEATKKALEHFIRQEIKQAEPDAAKASSAISKALSRLKLGQDGVLPEEIEANDLAALGPNAASAMKRLLVYQNVAGNLKHLHEQENIRKLVAERIAARRGATATVTPSAPAAPTTPTTPAAPAPTSAPATTGATIPTPPASAPATAPPGSRIAPRRPRSATPGSAPRAGRAGAPVSPVSPASPPPSTSPRP